MELLDISGLLVVAVVVLTRMMKVILLVEGEEDLVLNIHMYGALEIQELRGAVLVMEV